MKREFILVEAEAMKPLVLAILKDATERYARVAHCRRQVNELVDCGRSQNYRLRKLYHEAQSELARADAEYTDVAGEIEDLGVQLLDPVHGVAGYPFLWSIDAKSRDVRESYFLLRLADDPDRAINSWRFADESQIRKIPSHWWRDAPAPYPPSEVESQSDQQT